jgi:hypothetical protein
LQDQPDGHADGVDASEGGVPKAPTTTESIVDALAVPFVPDVANNPTRSASGITSVTELPGMSV